MIVAAYKMLIYIYLAGIYCCSPANISSFSVSSKLALPFIG